MADKKFTDLTLLPTADATDVLPLVDVSANTSKQTTVAGLATAVAASVPVGSIGASALSASAIKLGGASLTANATISASATAAAVTGLSASVTIPSGGREVSIEVMLPFLSAASTSVVLVSIWDGTVGSGTQLQESRVKLSDSSDSSYMVVKARHTPSAGAKTYNVGAYRSGGNCTVNASATAPAYISVECK